MPKQSLLEVNEIFGPTIQGEGKLVGNPSVFIRFGKCNMSCEGFAVEYETPSGIKKCSCDSYHAADIAFKEQWHSMSAQDIINDVSKRLPNYNIDIVITGGEPLLYWNHPEFQKLLEYYINRDFKLTIETNASLNIDFTKDYQNQILFSMSVKLSNSLEPLKKRINEQTLKKIVAHTNESYLKFVVDKDFIPKAKSEIQSICSIIPQCEVYLMPMGDTAQDINEHSKDVIQMAIECGYKYCDRLHIRVWDNQRGV